MFLDTETVAITFIKRGMGGFVMEKTRYSIPNISCGHCVTAIERGLRELEGIVEVEGDPALKRIQVAWAAPATEERIRKKLEEIRYPAAD